MVEMADVEIPPPDVLARGMRDMGAGARHSVQLALDMWRAGRMPLSELDELLRSFAWQSPQLRGWFDVVGKKRQKSPDSHLEAEMLTLEEMEALMEGATKRPRQEENERPSSAPPERPSSAPGAQSEREASGSPPQPKMRKSVSMAHFEDLELAPAAEEAWETEAWETRPSGLTVKLGRLSLGRGSMRRISQEPATAKTAATHPPPVSDMDTTGIQLDDDAGHETLVSGRDVLCATSEATAKQPCHVEPSGSSLEEQATW
jgi:hypothetical protein